MKKISDSTIEQLRGIYPDELVVHGIIKPAPNHKGKFGYVCPLCHSGEGGNHRNGVGDGAGTFDEHNRFYCHACNNVDKGGHKLSPIDLFAIARNLEKEKFGVIVREMATEFGVIVDEEDFDLPRRIRTKQPAKSKSPKSKIEPAEIELIRADLNAADEPLKNFVESCGGFWRGLPFEILHNHGAKFIEQWTPPKSRVDKKFATPTPRILIPSGNDFYIARFCGNLDDYDGATRKFVEDAQKLNAGSTKLFLSKPDVLDSDSPVFATEGTLDAVSIELAGFGAVALNGRGNCNLLVDALAEKTKKPRVIILFDADEPGRKAAPTLHDALINIGVPCVVRFLFDDVTKTDANDILIRDGEENLRGLLQTIVDNSLAELDAVARELEKEKDSLLSDELLSFLFSGNHSDLAFAYRLEKFCGSDVRWLTDDEKWLIYDKGVWQRGSEKNSCVAQFGRKLADILIQYATNKDERSLADKFQSAKKIGAAVTLLKSCDSIRIKADDLDNHPELLNCLNGVVDLQTGKFYPHDSNLLITQQCRADFQPNAHSELVNNFFKAIMPDEMTRAGLLRWLGYCLTGETSAEKFAVWTGKSGANGKGTLSGTLLELLGSYATGLAPRALLKSNRPVDADKATTSLNALENSRFAISEEMPLDGELDSSLVKNLTGGDRINIRKNFGEYRTIRATAKLNLSGNFTPRIENVHDGGILRRLINFSFDVQFGTSDNPADPALKKKLLLPENLRGLLSLLVRESVAWYRDGLIISSRMENATRQHLSQNDFIEEFVADNYIKVPNASVKAKDLIDDLRREYPRETSRFKRADLIQLVAAVEGVTYAEGRGHTRIFSGIGKLAPESEFNGEPIANEDFPFD